MEQRQIVTPLKVGLLIVALAYFLFNLHALFTLEWVGEWDRIGGGAFRFAILVEDVTAFVGVIFRFLAGIIAMGVAAYYSLKRLPSTQKAYQVLRIILVFEALYWVTLLPTAYFEVSGLTIVPVSGLFNYLAWTAIPALVESIVPTVTLLILATKLNPNKPANNAIKWALISGTIYVAAFWLLNMGSWMLVIIGKGTQYLTNYPQHILSFAITVFGLLFLTIYSGYFTWKSRRVQNLQELNLRASGAIIAALGLYFLWNYLSWIFFGGDYVWSSWYAWFLGHNMDLWMLSLPLVGLPLLFYRKSIKQITDTENKNA
jgi:hypothetical protein